MPYRIPKPNERVIDVQVTDLAVTLILEDGRQISTPLNWFPKLLDANEKQRSNWTLCCSGFGVWWPLIDENISPSGMLDGVAAARARNSLS